MVGATTSCPASSSSCGSHIPGSNGNAWRRTTLTAEARHAFGFAAATPCRADTESAGDAGFEGSSNLQTTSSPAVHSLDCSYGERTSCGCASDAAYLPREVFFGRLGFAGAFPV